MKKLNNRITQFRPESTKKTHKNRHELNKTSNSIPTRARERSQPHDLLLFPDKERIEPAYPLQIEAIAYRSRISPEFLCRLVHVESGLRIPGQFTVSEATEILKTTRYWDWTLEEERRPRCRERLLRLLERVCSRSQEIGGEG